MNERLKRSLEEFEIEGTIKRFELCYELARILIKEYLENLGIICKNPINYFKEAVNNDLVIDSENWLNMIEDKNLLVHTYNFKNSRVVFEYIKNSHLKEFKILLRRVTDGQ